MSNTNQDFSPLASARRTLRLESEGLRQLSESLGPEFVEAVEILHRARGRVIVTGMGKSGHVGRKIAATLASTGTPAHYVHPAEAGHGDLGMITTDDVVLALSWSGETAELKATLDFTKRYAIPMIALTSDAGSTLGRAATVALALPKAEEACPNGLAPTTSTTMQLALGDAISIALLELNGFTAKDFSVFHPGGKLGSMLRHVRDMMHGPDRMPLAGPDMAMADALVLITNKGFGCLGVIDEKGDLIGIITDGDLRRHMSADLTSRLTREVMTANPKTIAPDMLAVEALKVLNDIGITSLFVVDAGKPVGLVHIHDFLREGVA